jgi:hypothetical protein
LPIRLPRKPTWLHKPAVSLKSPQAVCGLFAFLQAGLRISLKIAVQSELLLLGQVPRIN